MDNTLTGLRNRATLFAQNWHNRGNEKSEARSYWMELLQDVLQLSDTNDPKNVCFERKTGLNGYIDVLMIKDRVLVEQKSLGVDLDKPEKRQGLMLTPIQQAKPTVPSQTLPDGRRVSLPTQQTCTTNSSTPRN